MSVPDATFMVFVDGGPGRNRTCDTWFRKPLLYPLSYGASSLVLYHTGFSYTITCLVSTLSGPQILDPVGGHPLQAGIPPAHGGRRMEVAEGFALMAQPQIQLTEDQIQPLVPRGTAGGGGQRSEERRVGKECRSRGWRGTLKEREAI